MCHQLKFDVMEMKEGRFYTKQEMMTIVGGPFTID